MEPIKKDGQRPAGVPPTPQQPGRSLDGFTTPQQTPPPPTSATPFATEQSPIGQPVQAQASQPAVASQPAANPTLQKTDRQGHIKGLVWFVAFIAGVIAVAFLINQFVFHSYFVEGTSMVPTLQNNDRLIIEKISRSLTMIQSKSYLPERGQIVVLNSSLIAANGSHEQLIKRVIGLPGDKIFIKDGVVTIKNQENPDGFDVDKQLNLDVEPTYSSEPLEFEVPDDSVFVMGDNRTQNGSHDSRAFGPVAAKDLEGRLWARILPIDKARIFP